MKVWDARSPSFFPHAGMKETKEHRPWDIRVAARFRLWRELRRRRPGSALRDRDSSRKPAFFTPNA